MEKDLLDKVGRFYVGDGTPPRPRGIFQYTVSGKYPYFPPEYGPCPHRPDARLAPWSTPCPLCEVKGKYEKLKSPEKHTTEFVGLQSYFVDISTGESITRCYPWLSRDYERAIYVKQLLLATPSLIVRAIKSGDMDIPEGFTPHVCTFPRGCDYYPTVDIISLTTTPF
jgi:hypothetical protein